jgi:hypothetical protein
MSMRSRDQPKNYSYAAEKEFPGGLQIGKNHFFTGIAVHYNQITGITGKLHIKRG